VCWGPASPGADEAAALGAALGLVRDHNARILVCPPHAGSQGLIDMGVHPGLEAGYQPVAEPGLDTRAMLQAAAAGELDALVIFGADLITDFPDAALAEQALTSNVFTVVVELLPTETVSFADVVLPSVAYAERSATFTNLERRLQKLEPVVAPPGTAREPWHICSDLARALGDDWGWSSFDDVWAALRKEVPTHAEVDPATLAQHIPESTLQYEYQLAKSAGHGDAAVAGPGGQYPKGHRQGAPFHTGQNWPLSWELRAFEAGQRPGIIPTIGTAEDPGTSVSGSATPAAGGMREFSEDTSNDVAIDASSENSRAPSAGDADPQSGAQGSSTGFRLISGRLIYDEGSMVARSTALRRVQRKAFVEISDVDAKELGIADGDEVVVVADGVEASVRAVITDIVAGTVFVPYHQEGLRANTLMSGGNNRVEVRRA
jgi:predicted molibdopterin-dependent oxidoreductase YjgC